MCGFGAVLWGLYAPSSFFDSKELVSCFMPSSLGSACLHPSPAALDIGFVLDITSAAYGSWL
jgi:hypothetical protein